MSIVNTSAAALCRRASSRTIVPHSLLPCSSRWWTQLQRRYLSSTSGPSSSNLPGLQSTGPKSRDVHRLLLAGVNPFLPPHVRNSTTPVFQEVPVHEWISSVSGRGAGASRMISLGGSGSAINQDDLEITNIAAGLGHFLIAYHDKRSGEGKIFAIGRNESGQLGLGYNSQVHSCHYLFS